MRCQTVTDPGLIRALPSLPPSLPPSLSSGDRVFSFWSRSSGSSFKTRVLAYYNDYCSWLFQAMLGRLSVGPPPPPPPPHRGSKVPGRFLSLDTLWRSHFRPYMGTSWPGWLGHFAFRRLGVHGQEPRHSVMVWHLKVRIYKFIRNY